MGARELSQQFIRRDGKRNILVIGDGTEVVLEEQPTVEKAKAQWADLQWIVEQLLKMQV